MRRNTQGATQSRHSPGQEKTMVCPCLPRKHAGISVDNKVHVEANDADGHRHIHSDGVSSEVFEQASFLGYVVSSGPRALHLKVRHSKMRKSPLQGRANGDYWI